MATNQKILDVTVSSHYDKERDADLLKKTTLIQLLLGNAYCFTEQSLAIENASCYLSKTMVIGKKYRIVVEEVNE